MMRWFTEMVGKTKKTHAFTLVELVIVVVIVGILAAVGLAMYRGYTRKAIATEATADLGTMRTALRVVYAQYEDYTRGGTIVVGAVGGQVPGIDDGDLDGSYFHHQDYSIKSIDATTFLLECEGTSSSGSPGHQGDAEDVYVNMNQDGHISFTKPTP